MKAQTHSRPVLTVSNPSPFLREQLREDSNRELDWLWAAEQVIVPEEARYCLERALYINPDNRDIRRALSKLVARQGANVPARNVKGLGVARSSDQ